MIYKLRLPLHLQPLRQPQHKQYTRTRMLELRTISTGAFGCLQVSLRLQRWCWVRTKCVCFKLKREPPPPCDFSSLHQRQGLVWVYLLSSLYLSDDELLNRGKSRPASPHVNIAYVYLLDCTEPSSPALSSLQSFYATRIGPPKGYVYVCVCVLNFT